MRMMKLSQWWWSKEKSIQFDCCKWKALSSRLMTNIHASALPSIHQMLTPFNISITLNWVIFYRLFSAKKPAYKYDEVCIFGDGKFKFSPPLDVSLQFKSWQYEFTDKSLTNWCAMKFEWNSLSLFLCGFDKWNSTQFSSCQDHCKPQSHFLKTQRNPSSEHQTCCHCSPQPTDNDTPRTLWYASNASWYIARNSIHNICQASSSSRRILLFSRLSDVCVEIF